MKQFYLFWISQFISTLGSSMTSYALALWVYARTGSALSMALLTMAGQLPLILAVFAGPFADKYSRRKMILLCDGIAGICTLLIGILLISNQLKSWYLYPICFLSALFNTFQSPAADAAVTQLITPEDYQKTAGLRALSWSLNSMAAPAFAGFLYIGWGLKNVIFFDLASCLAAMLILALFIQLPDLKNERETGSESGQENSRFSLEYKKLFQEGYAWLKEHKLVYQMMIYIGLINLIEAIYETALPVLALNRSFGGEGLYSLMRSAAGLSMCISALVMVFAKPGKNPVKTITLCILISFGSENFLLALVQNQWIYVLAEMIGWASIPVMNASLDVFYRSHIPADKQGRIFALRNTVQFAAIPFATLFAGTILEDVFQPLMADTSGIIYQIFGSGKAAGAALLLLLIAISGALISLIYYFRLTRLERKSEA